MNANRARSSYGNLLDSDNNGTLSGGVELHRAA